MRVLLTTLIGLVFASMLAQAEQDWPQFRGPRGDGTSKAASLPLRWNESSNIVWKAQIPGRGRSSPVVLGERVWLTTAREEGVRRTRIGSDDMQTAERVSLEVVCLDRADGNLLWHVPLLNVTNPAPVHWLNSWATPTPAVEAGRLYCDFGGFGTACLDAGTGAVLWQTQLPLDHQVGPGSSVVLWNKLLVLVRDGRDAQYLTALDTRSGEPVWKTARPPIETDSPNLRKSFSTPLIVEYAGRTQLLSPGAHWIVAYDPANGAEHWRLRHGEGFSFGACPSFGHGLAFFSTGCSKAQLLAVRADGQGDVTASHVVWRTPRQVPVMSSPVLVGEELYWVSDGGIACCVAARTGEVHWQERLGASFLASPLAAEGRLYFFAQDGKTTVLKADKAFERLAENELEGPVIATPALVDGAIILRTDTALYRIGTPKK